MPRPAWVTKPISFTRNIGFKEIEVNLGAYLVIADTGIHGNTREAVEKVEAIGLDALSDLNRLGELSQQAEGALKAKNQKLLGQLMSQAHNHLKSLGVSCDLSDLLVATALEHGALGAKMSGGGLGGCIIALTSTEDQAQTIAKKLQEKRSRKHVDRKPVSVKSYANIAIVKYWGKADAERMIPSTSSISLTLENMYTETKLSFLTEDATSDVMYIDDELQGEKETVKASKVLDLFRTNPNQHVKIETWNNMPTAAGFIIKFLWSFCPS